MDFMMSNKSIISLILIILFFIPISLASFTITPDINTISLCPRSTQIFVDKIKNTGNSMDYTVSGAGSASAWSTTVPTGFSLAQNGEAVLYTYITPKSSTYPGDYDVQLIVSSGAEVKTINHKITVKDCHVLELSSVSNIKSVCPSEIAN